MSMFSRIRSGRTDFGITMTPRWGQPPQHDLPHGLAVCGCDLAEERVDEKVVAAFGERAPGFDLNACLRISSWSAVRWKNGWVSIWLTAGVISLCSTEVDEPVWVEVRHAHRLGEPRAVDLLHRAPSAVVIAERLMDEIEVDVVQAQALQEASNARRALFSPGCFWIHSLVVTNSSSR